MKHFTFKSIILFLVICSLLMVTLKLSISVYQAAAPLLGRILFPFLLAFLIHYLLAPILHRLTDTLNMHKTSAIVVLFVFFFSMLGLLLYKGFPLLVRELQEISEQLPYLVTLYTKFTSTIDDSTALFPEAVREEINALLLQFEQNVKQFVEKILYRLIHLFDDALVFLMVPVLVFYMLKDDEHLRDGLNRLIPNRYHTLTNRILTASHDAFGTYIRGQTILSTFIFVLSFLFFYFIQLKYAFVLSLFMGMMNIIPYFGPIIGTIPAMIVAVATSWPLVLYVVLIAMAIQLIESTLLSPYIMGKTAQLHPVMIILILLVSGEIAGMIGMMIAIPIVMIFRAIIAHVVRQEAMH